MRQWFGLAGLLIVCGGLNAELIHHWTLDDPAGSASALDSVTGASAAAVPSGELDFGQPGADGTCAYFRTDAVRIELGSVSPGRDPFTLSLWFKMKQFRGLHLSQDHIISSNNLQAGRWNVHLLAAENGPHLQFFHNGWTGGDSGGSTAAIPDPILPNQWYHLVLIREADHAFTILLNDVVKFSGINLAALTEDSTKGVWLGRRPNNQSPFDGWIDDVRIYSGGVVNAAGVLSPTHGAVYVDPAPVVLRWSEPADLPVTPLRYDVYFGTDAARVADLSSPEAFTGSVEMPDALCWNVGNLALNTVYYWRIDTVYPGDTLKHGPVWSFTTEYTDIPGVVINHSPNPANTYVGCPGIVILPDGSYAASHSWFGSGTTNDTTVISKSTDRGRTWKQISTIKGQWWSTLFWHNDALYIMGVSASYGKSYIRKSTDGGATWTTPADSTNGILFNDTPYHCAPVPVVIHNGRLWRAMEDAQDAGGWGDHFRAFMMSAPVTADLLRADSWLSSNRLSHDKANWTGNGWLEGNAVVDPDGHIVNILRVDAPDVAAIVRISADGATATFDPVHDFVPFHGGASKFTIRYDTVSGRYWSLVNKQLNPTAMRNRLVLVSSADLRNWVVEDVILEHPDTANHAWQYVDWLAEGDDMIFVSRTAYDTGLGTQAHTYHDANFLTFHRIKYFRGPRAPYFDRQPGDVQTALNQAAVFSVQAHSGITAFRWFRSGDGGDTELFDGGAVSIVSTDTESTLTIHSVTASDLGGYSCAATNPTDTTTSRTAMLTRYVRSLRAHWRLDETSPGAVAESTGNYPSGELWGTPAVGLAGPTGGADLAYNFSGGTHGASTNATTVIPADTNFSLSIWFKTSNYHSSQGHLFSNNNGQVGRANMLIQNGQIAWWTHNGPYLTAGPRVDDNRWHHALVTRRGTDWTFRLDGHVVGTQTLGAVYDQATVWLIGRARQNAFPFEGLIGDVKVYDYAVDDIPDMTGDGRVDLYDAAVISEYWQQTDCGVCGGADLSLDGSVTLTDLALLIEHWLY